jgi:hypothetical protein
MPGLGLGIAPVIIGIQEEAESYGEIESKFFVRSGIHENLCLQQEPKVRWRKFWVYVGNLCLGIPACPSSARNRLRARSGASKLPQRWARMLIVQWQSWCQRRSKLFWR